MVSAFVRTAKLLPSVLVDAAIVSASLLLAWSGRSITAPLDIRFALVFCVLGVCVFCLVNSLFGVYHRLWRYASAAEVAVIGASAVISTTLLLVFDLVVEPGQSWRGNRMIPVSVVLLMGFFAFAGFVGVRYRARLWKGWRPHWEALRGRLSSPRARVLIVGAGEDGQLLAWRLLNQREGEEYRLVGFVDDDPSMIGMRLHGRPILGNRQAIPDLVSRYRIDLVIIGNDSLGNEALRDVLAVCEHTSARVKVLPNIFDLIHRTDGLSPLRDVTAEDLLGRKPVEIDRTACRALLAGKTVLVTGAAGSIGSELCRQIAAFDPQRLLMLDNNESGLFDLIIAPDATAEPGFVRRIVGDVTDHRKMQAIFARYRPQIVFHAAAYKHVPLMEDYPEEAVRVNVLGTQSVLDLACQHRAERFVLISTDKAVSPTCVMGATKRIGEMLISSADPGAPTLCTGVRFGNVLGSRGSVVPTFERQIEVGGPVTITHPDMTRFFMSIPEAVSLVIQAATVTTGGDLFVLDMGEQVRIEELAERLIRLRGLRPGVDIPIKYTGIRNGEKLHEELTSDDDDRQPTPHPAIFRIRGNHQVERDRLLQQIDELQRLAGEQDGGSVVTELWNVVGR